MSREEEANRAKDAKTHDHAWVSWLQSGKTLADPLNAQARGAVGKVEAPNSETSAETKALQVPLPKSVSERSRCRCHRCHHRRGKHGKAADDLNQDRWNVTLFCQG